MAGGLSQTQRQGWSMPTKPEDWDTLFTHGGLSNASLAGGDAPRSPAELEEHENMPGHTLGALGAIYYLGWQNGRKRAFVEAAQCVRDMIARGHQLDHEALSDAADEIEEMT